MNFDWNDLAFGNKKPLNDLKAIFVAAPREVSLDRFKQIIKTYLPKANIILGVSKEPYVAGLEDQLQFRMLKYSTVEPLISKVNGTKPAHTISTLSYSQRDLRHILDKLKLKKVILVNGSWYQSFHFKPEYYMLVNRKIPFQMISPFVDEAEAREYAKRHAYPAPKLPATLLDDIEMLALANEAAKQSFDYSTFQTGCALGRQEGQKYRALATSFNRVVPYQTYPMHYGAIREISFSPSNDLNLYDTNHYEVELIIQALEDKLDLEGTSIFANVMHCPTCARMLSRTKIREFVYAQDHSDGYAVKLLELANKKVRRLV